MLKQTQFRLYITLKYNSAVFQRVVLVEDYLQSFSEQILTGTCELFKKKITEMLIGGGVKEKNKTGPKFMCLQ